VSLPKIASKGQLDRKNEERDLNDKSLRYRSQKNKINLDLQLQDEQRYLPKQPSKRTNLSPYQRNK
jgi:hypothetical protein